MTPRHKFVHGLTFAIAVCCMNQIGFSQVNDPDQPVYQAVPVYGEPVLNSRPCQSSQMVMPTPGCNCGCGGSSGCFENPGNGDLVVTPRVLWSNKKTTKICVDPPSDTECVTTSIKFYEKDVPFDADIWAYDIQGLLSKAILAFNVTTSEASKKLETSFNY